MWEGGFGAPRTVAEPFRVGGSPELPGAAEWLDASAEPSLGD